MITNTVGRTARTIEEAKEYIGLFILGTEHPDDPRESGHMHDYDLFLPWLIQVVESIAVPHAENLPTYKELGLLYMDAAWMLVQEGLLRPGPREIMGDVGAGYGKGYSLTPKGRQWIADLESKRKI